MRTFSYRLIAVLVAVASIVSFLVWILKFGPAITSYLSLLTVFADPLPLALLSLASPMFSAMVQLPLKWVLLLLVLHRLYCIVRDRQFSTPPSYARIAYFLGLIGAVSFFLALLLLGASLIPSIGFALGWVSVPIYGLATFTIPLAFTISELISLRVYVAKAKA